MELTHEDTELLRRAVIALGYSIRSRRYDELTDEDRVVLAALDSLERRLTTPTAA